MRSLSCAAKSAPSPLLGVVGVLCLTLVSPDVPSAFAQKEMPTVKMKETFKNVSKTDANDFHLEGTTFILTKPEPKSDAFKKVKQISGTKEADFSDGTVKAGNKHTVEWTAAGKKSGVEDSYFTKDGKEIEKSSERVALTTNFDLMPQGDAKVSLASAAPTNVSGVFLTGTYALYAKPSADFDQDTWDDLGDARPLQLDTPYALENGASLPPHMFSVNGDEYILVVGTADEGDGAVPFTDAFGNRPPEGVPVPDPVPLPIPLPIPLLTLGVLGIVLYRRRSR